jgi:hypothetical protein
MQVIDVSKLNQDGRCVFGTTITLMNLTDDSEIPSLNHNTANTILAVS